VPIAKNQRPFIVASTETDPTTSSTETIASKMIQTIIQNSVVPKDDGDSSLNTNESDSNLSVPQVDIIVVR
jgi:hypothetical protein